MTCVEEHGKPKIKVPEKIHHENLKQNKARIVYNVRL